MIFGSTSAVGCELSHFSGTRKQEKDKENGETKDLLVGEIKWPHFLVRMLRIKTGIVHLITLLT